MEESNVATFESRMKCQNCRWFDNRHVTNVYGDAAVYGICRYGPPTIHGRVYIELDGWCKEFTDKTHHANRS